MLLAFEGLSLISSAVDVCLVVVPCVVPPLGLVGDFLWESPDPAKRV